MFHLVAGFLVGAAHRRFFNLFEREAVQVQRAAIDFANGIHPGDDFGAVDLLQEFLGDCTCGNASDGFAGRAASTAAVVPESVLKVVAQVGVARTVPLLDFGVVVAALVFVKDGE